MIKKLELIEMELYCLNAPIKLKASILIKNELDAYFSLLFGYKKKKWNIDIPEFNF